MIVVVICITVGIYVLIVALKRCGLLSLENLIPQIITEVSGSIVRKTPTDKNYELALYCAKLDNGRIVQKEMDENLFEVGDKILFGTVKSASRFPQFWHFMAFSLTV